MRSTLRMHRHGLVPHVPAEQVVALGRAVPGSLAIVLLVLAAAEFNVLRDTRMGRELATIDITYYLEAVRRWLALGTPYLARDVAGPFDYSPETFLHPPIALYLFAPFTVLPLACWWLIPLGILGWSIRGWRPDRWAWPLIALCLLWPRTHASLIFGNTDMWVAAFVALGLRHGWPGVLVAIKPSFAPLVFVGAARRSWWIAGAAVALAALPLGSLWLDWLAVIRHAPAGLTYSVGSVPMILLPVLAWVRRTRQRSHVDARVGPAIRAGILAGGRSGLGMVRRLRDRVTLEVAGSIRAGHGR